MKKRLYLVITLLLFGTVLFAQQAGTETIYLKNGTIVSGNIIEMVPNVSYTIKTADGNIFVFEIADILKISYGQANSAAKADKTKAEAGESTFTVGYHGIVEAGFGVGMGSYGLDMFKLDFVNGHRFDEHLFVGGGIGLRQPFDGDLSFIPIFINGRYNLDPKANITPIGSINLGVAFNTSDGLNEGGVLFNPAFGICFNKTANSSMHATIGYDVMQMPFYSIVPDYWNPYLIKRIRYAESFVINVGYTF